MKKSRLLIPALALGLLTSLGAAQLASAQQTVTVQIGPGRDDATATGSATLTAMGNQTRVDVNVAGTNPSMPGHIHADACPGAGPVVFPLSPTVNGRSSTTLDAPLATVLAQGKSLNLHKSAAEAGVYTGCGNLAVAGATAPAQVPAALPRTGDAASLAPLLVAAGAGLAGAGYALRRRRR